MKSHQILKKRMRTLLLVCSLFFICNFAAAQSTIPGSEVAGSWNLAVETETGDRPSWLKIETSGINALVGHFVGIEGSARPISEIKYNEETGLYSFTIPPQWLSTTTDMKVEFIHSDDRLEGTTSFDSTELFWTGERAPDLRRSGDPIWGEPIRLIDTELSHWIIGEDNHFRVDENNILINEEIGDQLITEERFDDFKISLEYNIPEGSNSGLYLRGRYEVQIADMYDMEPTSTSVGGVYGFIVPTVNASKPAGEWQTLEVSLIGRMVSVTLNGVEVICNRPIPGTTGGALNSDEAEPGPIMLQGDHGPVRFRNIEITPVNGFK